MRPVHVIGVGMSRFGKTGMSLKELAAVAVRGALSDARLDPSAIQAAYAANAAAGLLTGQEMIRGQVLLRPLGLDALPVVNVENACASGSTAIHLGWQAVAHGIHDVVLCLGAEKMTAPVEKAQALAAIGAATDVEEEEGQDGAAVRSKFMDLSAERTHEYMARSGATPHHLAQVVVKNQHNGARNPLAQYGGEITEEEVLASREIAAPLTLLMCSPVSDGAAAVIIAADGRGPRIRGSSLVSGRDYDPARPGEGSAGRAARAAYDAAGLGPHDVDCAEVHDAAAIDELLAYEELGLAAPGDAPRLIDGRETFLGGRVPVNTSGGLICRGHPIGATGVAQICEAVWQLRGEAGDRQVTGARVAVTHNGGGWIGEDQAAASVHVLTRD
jgi:acetyl-CoA acetyltransferase